MTDSMMHATFFILHIFLFPLNVEICSTIHACSSMDISKYNQIIYTRKEHQHQPIIYISTNEMVVTCHLLLLIFAEYFLPYNVYITVLIVRKKNFKYLSLNKSLNKIKQSLQNSNMQFPKSCRYCSQIVVNLMYFLLLCTVMILDLIIYKATPLNGNAKNCPTFLCFI